MQKDDDLRASQSEPTVSAPPSTSNADPVCSEDRHMWERMPPPKRDWRDWLSDTPFVPAPDVAPWAPCVCGRYIYASRHGLLRHGTFVPDRWQEGWYVWQPNPRYVPPDVDGGQDK